MKRYFIIVIVSLLAGSSCNKELPSYSNAIITGFDLRTCACCGGLMVTFNGETQPYMGDFKLIENNPADFGISETDKFPIYAKVEWKPDTTNVCNHIIITKFERR